MEPCFHRLASGCQPRTCREEAALTGGSELDIALEQHWELTISTLPGGGDLERERTLPLRAESISCSWMIET